MLAVGDPLAGGDELADQRGESRVTDRELARRGEAGPAVDVIVGAALGVPGAGAGPQLAVEDEIGAGLLEPGGQPRPGTEHDLVDDVDHPVVALDEAGIDEGVDGGAELGRHLVDGQPPAHPLTVVGHVDETHHHVAGRIRRRGPARRPARRVARPPRRCRRSPRSGRP